MKRGKEEERNVLVREGVDVMTGYFMAGRIKDLTIRTILPLRYKEKKNKKAFFFVGIEQFDDV